MTGRFQTFVLVALLTLGLPRAAAGFWPLDRNVRVVTDSLSADDWQSRFETWRQRPLGDSAATADPLAEVRKAAQMGKIDPSLIARLAQQAKEGKLPGAVTSETGPAGVSPSPAQTTMGSPDSTVADGSFPDGFSPAAGDSLDASGNALSDSVDSFGNPISAPGSQSPGSFGNVAPPPNASLLMMQRGFAPAFRATLTSNNDRMRFDTSLASSFNDPSNVALTASLMHTEELRLSQGSENDNNGLNLSLTAPVRRLGFTFGISAGGNRRSSLGARSATAARTKDRSENRLAQASASFSRSLVTGLGVNAYYARNFTADEQVTITTSTQDERSTRTTGNSFGVGARVDRLQWLKLHGSYGRNRDTRDFGIRNITSESITIDDSSAPSDGDTVTVRAEMPLGRIVPQLTAEFQVRRSDYSYTDLNRTQSGASQAGYRVETETRFSRVFRLQGNVEPLSFLSANFSYEVARDSVSAVLRTSLFEDAKRQRLSLGGSLRTPWKGEIRLRYSATKSDVDKDDPTNPDNRENSQTRTDEGRDLSGEYSQNFTSTLKVRAYGNVSLSQGFYVHEGPTGKGDRDDSRAQIGLDLDGRISRKATAQVKMYVRAFDQAFIDNRRSRDSRDETEYVIHQRFNYQITPHVLLRQFYGLSSKVVDEVYDPNSNTLNRNHFLQTSMNYKMTSRLTLDARLDYRLQDNGFYVQVDPQHVERIFAASARTKTNEVALSMRYALISNNKLTFVSDQVATREYRSFFDSGRFTGTNVTNRGNLGLGLESKITLNDLALDASVRRNQSFNVSLNRTVYYDVRSTLSYTF